MDVAVVGGGPTGLYCAVAMARRGHAVTVVDRDPGPTDEEAWPRRGVMQFHHPHGFRPQVNEALAAEWPEVWHDLVAAGAEPTIVPDQPDIVRGFRCRRLTFERVLRAAAEREPGLELRLGHVDDIVSDGGRAGGLVVDGHTVEADLVLDASGRAGRLGRRFRGPAEGGDCGMAYVSRQYRLHPGAERGPTNSPIGMVAAYPGYVTIVFIHDHGVFSTLIARASSDDDLAGLRDVEAFDAAARAVPALATWTDPDRARPITPVLPGGRLHNSYRGQYDGEGRIPVAGLIFVGDAVCTTNPTAGRGIATSLMQARTLVGLLDEHPGEPGAAAEAFDAWCAETIRPWFLDHVEVDADVRRRWAGGDVDVTRRLPSDLVVAASAVDPSMMRVVGPYLGMAAPPGCLDTVRDRAREIYAEGWRPPVPDGPTRDELAELVAGRASAPRNRSSAPRTTAGS